MLEQTPLCHLEAFISMEIRCRANTTVVSKELNVWSVGTRKFVVQLSNEPSLNLSEMPSAIKHLNLKNRNSCLRCSMALEIFRNWHCDTH